MTEPKKYSLNEGNKSVFYTLDELKELYERAKTGFMKLGEHWQECLVRIPTLPMAKGGYNNEPGIELAIHSLYRWSARNAKEDGKTELLGSSSRFESRSSYGYSNQPKTDVRQLAKDAVQKAEIEGKAEIARLLKKNDDFIRRVQKDRLRPQDCLYWAGTQGTKWVLHGVSKNLKSTCELCSEKVNPDQLAYHKRTVKCKERATLRAIEEKGFKWTNDTRITQAIKNGVVVGELVPIKYHVYAPTWVIDAAGMYDKQKGYAGMEFSDFINRMCPEKT